MNRIAMTIIWALWLVVAAFPQTDPIKVVVFPLNGPPETESLAWVGEGIAESLSVQLSDSRIHAMHGGQLTELMEDMGFFRGVRLSRGSMISIAKRASADMAVMGSFEGTERNIGISVRVFYLEKLKLSGTISANGPLSILPQMENEMAWQILTEMGLEKSPSREKYYERTRKIPNSAFEFYIQSLGAHSDNDRRRLLLKAVDSYGNFPEAQSQLGRLYYQKGDWKSALRHLTLAGGDGDIPMDIEFIMGMCYMQTDQPQLAIAAFSRILGALRSFEILNNLGVAHLRAGESALALNAFVEANSLAPTNSKISLNLSIAQQIRGNASIARSTVEEAIKADPRNGMLHFMMGFILKSQGEEEKAALALQEAKDLDIPIQKFLADDPKAWAQVFSKWSAPKDQPAIGRHQSDAH